MTATERMQMAGQIECLLKEIDNYQASITNLNATPAIILLVEGVKSAAENLGELQYRYHNEKAPANNDEHKDGVPVGQRT